MCNVSWGLVDAALQGAAVDVESPADLFVSNPTDLDSTRAKGALVIDRTKRLCCRPVRVAGLRWLLCRIFWPQGHTSPRPRLSRVREVTAFAPSKSSRGRMPAARGWTLGPAGRGGGHLNVVRSRSHGGRSPVLCTAFRPRTTPRGRRFQVREGSCLPHHDHHYRPIRSEGKGHRASRFWGRFWRALIDLETEVGDELARGAGLWTSPPHPLKISAADAA